MKSNAFGEPNMVSNTNVRWWVETNAAIQIENPVHIAVGQDGVARY
jgi:hypothetical protein